MALFIDEKLEKLSIRKKIEKIITEPIVVDVLKKLAREKILAVII